jgi:hypothetical protein
MNEINTGIECRFMDWDCVVILAQYMDGGAPAILLRDANTGEPIATATTNLGYGPAAGNVMLKTWSENEGIDEALKDAGVLSTPQAIHPAGMTFAVEYSLSEKVKDIVARCMALAF